jgi:hypothetical protein
MSTNKVNGVADTKRQGKEFLIAAAIVTKIIPAFST